MSFTPDHAPVAPGNNSLPQEEVKKPLTKEEQEALDAKYAVGTSQEQKGSDFVELTPDDSGDRRVMVGGQKYVLQQVFADDGGLARLDILPYSTGEKGEIIYGEPLKDTALLRDVMNKISPETVRKNIENASVSLRQLAQQYDQKTAWAVRELFKGSVPDDEQEKMAQDIFGSVDTRVLYDAYFSTPSGDLSPLKGTAFSKKLAELEDNRLKQAGYSQGLEGSSVI